MQSSPDADVRSATELSRVEPGTDQHPRRPDMGKSLQKRPGSGVGGLAQAMLTDERLGCRGR